MTTLLQLLIVLFELPGFLCTVTTVGDLAVLEGGSVTIPCHYDPQYTANVKYWCRGRMREFCSSLARTDEPESTSGSHKMTIVDDPTQQVFTVSMRDLMEEDTGWYWCGVELGGMWVADSAASVYISVIQGMSVVSSVVSGEEGKSLSVQCLYSKNLRSLEKRWCRSGSWHSCVQTDSSGSSSDGNVRIHDDRSGVFSVSIVRLEARDAGWYWCGAGQQHVAVHVTVRAQATTSTASAVPSLITTVWNQSVQSTDQSSSRAVWESPLVVCGVVLLTMSALLALWKLKQECKRKPRHHRADEINDNLTMSPWREGEYKNVIFLNTPAQQAQIH